MKVCTDACLFGAWVAEQVQSKKGDLRSILDIGAGTGLLSLMLAQKTNAQIDAIELDQRAAEQAAENFANSPWLERLQVIQGDARFLQLKKKYDLIISNPPFFENDLKSSNKERNLALHSEELSFRSLTEIVENNLGNQGLFAVLLPFPRKEEMIDLAEKKGLLVQEAVSVKQSDTHPYFRTMLLFNRTATTGIHTSVTIREKEKYSAIFTKLLADYYLN